MHYLILIISSTLFLNKLSWYSTINWILLILAIVLSSNNTSLHLMTEYNMTYNKQLEFLYNIADIAINSNKWIHLIITVAFVIIIKNLTLLKYRQEIHNSIFLESVVFYTAYYFNNYYILKNNNWFPLHENIISVIHPFITTLSMLLIFGFFFTKKINKITIDVLLVYYCILISILLGGTWAASTNGWGGVWAWDPTEIILLLLGTFILFIAHRKKYKHKSYIITFLFCICYLKTNKFNLVNGIHNFYSYSLSKSTYLLIYTLLFILALALGLYYLNYFLQNVITILLLVEGLFFILTNNDIQWNIFLLNNIYIKYLFIVWLVTSTNFFITKNKFILLFSIILTTLVVINDKNVYLLLIIIVLLVNVISRTMTCNRWITKSHLLHVVLILILITNYELYVTYTIISANTILKEILIEKTYNINFYQSVFYYLELSDTLLTNLEIFKITTKTSEGHKNIDSLYFQTYSFKTNLTGLSIYQWTKIDTILKICTGNEAINILNFYNNSVIFITYWILFLYLLKLKKW